MQTVDLTKECKWCGDVNKITVTAVEYMNWQMGDLIQDAMPTLSKQEREQIVTGTCATCWSKF